MSVDLGAGDGETPEVGEGENIFRLKLLQRPSIWSASFSTHIPAYMGSRTGESMECSNPEYGIRESYTQSVHSWLSINVSGVWSLVCSDATSR